MPRHKQAYGWKDGATFYLSLMPREANGACNGYANAVAALADAQRRKMQVQWEDTAAVDKS